MPFRSHLKEEAHKRHEEEKNYMATLQAVGFTVSHYTGHSVAEDDNGTSDDNGTPDDNCTTDQHTVDIADIHTPNSLLKDTLDASSDEGERLLFLYDCETTGGSFHNDHIMELASVVIVPDDISISKPSFTSLCHTSRRIVQKGLYTIIYECICDVLVTSMVISIVSEKCGITTCMLYNQPSFSNVFQQYIKWLEHCVQEVQQQKGVSYLPGILFTFNISI